MIFLRVSPAGYCEVCFSGCVTSDFLLPPSLPPLCVSSSVSSRFRRQLFDVAMVKTTSPPPSCSESFLRDSVTQSCSAVKQKLGVSVSAAAADRNASIGFFNCKFIVQLISKTPAESKPGRVLKRHSVFTVKELLTTCNITA